MKNPDYINGIEAPKIHGQGVFTVNVLPINEDYLAVGQAIQSLLNEGWKFRGIVKDNDKYFIELNREWKC